MSKPPSTSGDSLIRTATAGVVVAVVAFAAVVSYSHIYDLGRRHGQDGTAAVLLPLSVDGLILAASLVMLHEAWAGRTAPKLGRAMLALGVGATVAANVGYGVTYGLVGALISAVPAVSFIGATEMLLQLIHRSRVPQRGPVGTLAVPPVPDTAEAAALAAYRVSVADGSPISARQLATRYGISRRKAGEVVATVTREANGHH